MNNKFYFSSFKSDEQFGVNVVFQMIVVIAFFLNNFQNAIAQNDTYVPAIDSVEIGKLRFDYKVQGEVVDARTGEPLIGCHIVLIEGYTERFVTLSDFDGMYFFDVKGVIGDSVRVRFKSHNGEIVENVIVFDNALDKRLNIQFFEHQVENKIDVPIPPPVKILPPPVFIDWRPLDEHDKVGNGEFEREDLEE